MIDTTTVGKGIAFLRKQKQMTQQGLAAAVNVSHQAVSKWENGVALPDMQTMLALSRLFGVSMEDILSGALLEAAEPVNEAQSAPAHPDVELKLDDGSLNMDIVAEADEIIDRAMDHCDEADAEDAQATVNIGMRFDEIVRMAPYVSGDALDAMLGTCEDEFSMEDIAAVAPYAAKGTLSRLLAGCRRVHWDSLRRLAPFVSRDALRDVLLMHVDGLTMDELRRLAPFMSRDGLAEVLNKMPGAVDFDGLKRLAPFMSKDALAEQLARHIERLTVDDLLMFAPFLKKDQLGELIEKIDQPIDRNQMIRLAKFLPRDQMDKLVYRAMGMKRPRNHGGDWDVSGEWNRAYQEIRDAVHTGMHEAREAIRMVGLDGVMDGINSTMKDVGGRINDAINTAWNNQQPRTSSAQDRSQRIRARIAEKALADGNWDWICSHISEMEGDLLKQVLMKCAAADHAELIEENLDRIALSSAECCRLAQTVVDEDIWDRLLAGMEEDHRRRVLDYIGRVQPDSLAQFERFMQTKAPLEQALELIRSEGDAAGAMELLNAQEQLELIRIAIGEEGCDVDDLLPHAAEEIMPLALELLLDNGCMEQIGLIVARTQEHMLPQMALTLAQKGAWAHLDELLSGVADVDLSEVWPLAVENQQWDVIDDIALHGDEATLSGMAMALAELGRFGELESFIEELDPDTLEKLLDKAMERSDWETIDRIGDLLN